MAESEIDAVKKENQNLMAALTYFLGFITGILFLLLEKNNKFVRFHAMQSTITFGGLFVLSLVVGFIPGFNAILQFIISIVAFILWIFLMFKAFSGEMYKLPYIGEIAEKQLSKMK